MRTALRATAPVFCDLLIVDDIVPSDFSPFRTLEYSHYLSYFDRSVLLSTEGWHGWASNDRLEDVLNRSSLPKKIKSKILHFLTLDLLVPRLAYITFLNNAWQMFPHLQERKIPFILQLYPGGGFEPNVLESDEKLRKLCSSSLCRRIVVTQNLSRNYLVEKIECEPSKIEFIYGGVYDTRQDFDFLRDKRRYPQHKKSIDLCFVAHRYGDDIRKKGYDHFVAVARLLAPLYPYLNFHVVGDYTPDQLPLGEASKRITFHGKQPNSFFREFYSAMDLILSVNRPINDDAGAFDGFPTGACMEAGFRGVLNCISDPLGMNVAFEDDLNIVLLDFSVDRTIQRISALISDPARMYELAYANWRKFVEVFDTDRQLWPRCQLISNELLGVETLVVRPAPTMSAMDGSLTPLRDANGRLTRDLQDAVRSRNALAVEVKGLAEGLVDMQQRHDNLLHEYRKLEKGLDTAQTNHASSLRAAQQKYDELANAYTVFTGDAELLPKGSIDRLERCIIRVLRSGYMKKLRGAFSYLAMLVSPKKP